MAYALNGFVISLDFELHWGVRDHRTVEQYRDNLLGARKAIPAMLDLFAEHNIHATWATVGFLFFQGMDDLRSHLPESLPAYEQRVLDPYPDLASLGKNEKDDPFHFAPGLIKQIATYDSQEIGTHTFSHFYALEKGPTLESFRADIKSAVAAAKHHGIQIKSIVFPRNQISRRHIQVCAEEGLISYRGIEADPWIASQNPMGKILRMANTYAGMSEYGCFTPYLDEEVTMVNIPGSQFLRPWNRKLSRLENLRINRIFRSMDTAAKTNRTYHLWWHPHNFGANLDENMAILTQIVQHYAALRDATGWQSFNMAEMAESILREEKIDCPA